MKIRIIVGQEVFSADLLENETAKAIYQALPFDLPYNTWGNEIYFEIPVHLELENGQEIMEIGDLAYWPPGHAFCIFYGKTPVSTDDRPRAASDVTRFGKITEGDPASLPKAKAAIIRIEKME